MLLAHRTGDVRVIASVVRIVVIADFLFTASAVVLQPITGARMAHIAGYPIFSGWIGLSILLYLAAGFFWLPVIWVQMRICDLAVQAVEQGTSLPPRYHQLFRIWFAFGFPTFGAVVAIFWLMITKP